MVGVGVLREQPVPVHVFVRLHLIVDGSELRQFPDMGAGADLLGLKRRLLGGQGLSFLGIVLLP